MTPTPPPPIRMGQGRNDDDSAMLTAGFYILGFMGICMLLGLAWA